MKNVDKIGILKRVLSHKLYADVPDKCSEVEIRCFDKSGVMTFRGFLSEQLGSRVFKKTKWVTSMLEFLPLLPNIADNVVFTFYQDEEIVCEHELAAYPAIKESA